MFDPSAVFEGNNGEATKAFYAYMDGLGIHGKLATALFRAQKRSTAASQVPDLRWGWKLDPSTPGYEWVLYAELPTGQVSFHSAERLNGPDFPGEWDGAHQSRERILAFCAGLIATTALKEEQPCA